MSQLERQQNILNALKSHPSLSIKELSKLFYASEASIRRDVFQLEKQGLVTHQYGGVALTGYRNAVTPLNIRDEENAAVKERIALQAASLVRNGDTLFADSSSTVRRMLQYLIGKQNIRIITNNQRIFSDYGQTDLKLYCTGGTYNPKNHNFLGADAEAYIRHVSADIVFFSSQGLSEKGDINDVSEEETSLRRVMISRAKRKVFLCDSSKIGVSRIFTLCNIAEVDDILCDQPEKIEKIRQNMYKEKAETASLQ